MVMGARLRSVAFLVRVGLAAFVAAWIFGPDGLRTAVPVWLPFLVALGLELQFFLAARRALPRARQPDRGPQEIDRELYGYAEPDEDEDEDDGEDEEEDGVGEDDELESEAARPERSWPIPRLV